MSIYPVDKYWKILRIISKQKIGVNQIFNLTGYANKQIITNAIKQLERAGLVNREKMNKQQQQEQNKNRQYKQKQFISPTKLGSELLDLYDDYIPRFQKYFDIFLKNFYEFDSYYDKIDDKPFQSVLKSREWDDKDIKYYKENNDNLWLFFRLLQNNILQFFSVRYSTIFSKIKSSKIKEPLTRDILATFIEVYNKSLQKISPLYIDEDKDNIDQDEKYYDLYEDLTFNGLCNNFYTEHWLFPKSMHNTIEDLMVSLLLILNPPIEIINKVVGHNKNIYRDPVVKAFNNFLKEEKR